MGDYLRKAGNNIFQNVIVAIMIGTITPQKETNFLNPELLLKLRLQVMNTKLFTASWRIPAIIALPVNKFV